MFRVRVHAVSCSWPRDSIVGGAEPVLLRLMGPGQSPKTYFLGRFPSSSSRRLVRISHVASGAVTLSLQTSSTGPLIGMYTLPPPQRPPGCYARHLVTFVSKGLSPMHLFPFCGSDVHLWQKPERCISWSSGSLVLPGRIHLRCCV